MCCGGRAPRGATRPLHGGVPRAPAAARATPAPANAVLLAYYGNKRGDFRVAGGVTRTQYHIPGPGEIVEFAATGKQGVHPADVNWFRSVNQGRDFRPIEAPRPAAPMPAPASAPKAIPQATPENSEAWEPAVMEAEPMPAPDIQSMTVREIRELELGPETAAALLLQEQTGKARKMVLGILEAQL